VNSAGTIVVGAVSFAMGSSTANGYFSAYSTDGGSTWHQGPFPLPSMPSGGGAQSRLVATNTHFEAFVPTLNNISLPTNVSRYESSDGINWTGPIFLINPFGAPVNNSPGSYCPPSGPCGRIFYAPLLDAKGYTNGLWTVGFQANNGGWNNMIACGSNLTPTCRFVNAAADDEFLTGVSVSGDGGYWFSYLTYSSLNTRQLPLIVQSFFILSGKPEIGATTYSTVMPTSWWLSLHAGMAPRCMTLDCFAAGDFNGIASNPAAGASTPFVQIASPTTRIDDLFQLFIQDPQGSSNVVNFVPNVVPITASTDLLSVALPVPADAVGVPPGDKVGFPGSNH
jgi:hypothetical protein